MKKLLSIYVVVLVGCISHTDSSIEGVYTREAVGEYSRAFDTLIVYDYNNRPGIFLVRRKTGFMRIKEGVEQPRQFREEQMLTDYNQSKNQLTDSKTGRVFSFKDGNLLFGTATYLKIQK